MDGVDATMIRFSSPVASTLPTEDLVLTNIFEFAVGDLNDFRSVSMVNKKWNRLFRSTALQLVTRICNLVRQKSYKVTYSYFPDLLEMILISLAMRTAANTTRPKKTIKLPSVSTKIALLLLFHEVLTSKETARKIGLPKFERPLYDKTCEYLEYWATLTARNMAQALKTNNGKNVSDILMGLLEEWNIWGKLTRTAIYIVGYLDRHFVKQTNLMPLSTRAHHYLFQAIVQQGLPLASSCEQLLQDCLLPENAADARPLLLQVHQACNTFQSKCLPDPFMDNIWQYDADIWDSPWNRLQEICEEEPTSSSS